MERSSGSLYDVAPGRVASDSHPDYLSSEVTPRAIGASRASRSSTTTLTSVPAWPTTSSTGRCSASRGTAPGYGTDGTVWGGEFLLTTADGFRRVASPPALPSPGRRRGDQGAPALRAGTPVRDARRGGSSIATTSLPIRAFSAEELRVAPADAGEER